MRLTKHLYKKERAHEKNKGFGENAPFSFSHFVLGRDLPSFLPSLHLTLIFSCLQAGAIPGCLHLQRCLLCMFSLHLPLLPTASAPPQHQKRLPGQIREVNRTSLAPHWVQLSSWHDAEHPPDASRVRQATMPCALQDLPVTQCNSKKTSLCFLWD